jgi:hypothetical protein
MPYLMPSADLSAVISVADKVALAPSGNRITDVSIFPPASGSPFAFRLQFGNNPPMGPFTMPCTVQFDPGAPDSDTREGLFLINDAAQAAVVVPIMVSYLRNDAREVGGVRVVA